jgi:outer membrane scaffolding protein for murein synthesis (MipA/OmpV family)
MTVPVATISAVLLLFPLAAQSADLDTSGTETAVAGRFDPSRHSDIRGTLRDWKVTVGGGAIYLPEYEGSDKFEVKPFPIFSAQFGDNVQVDVTGVTVDLYRWEGFRFAVRGGYETGRKESDSDYLRGLGDIDPGGVVGGVVSYETGPFEVYAALNKTFGGSEGLTGTFGAKASHRFERFIFSADVSGTWADSKYMESYFGITSAQASSSGLPQYTAGAGIKRLDVRASVTYMLTDNWLLTGAAGAGFLMGDAKDSPIVKDDVQPFAMLGMGYRF